MADKQQRTASGTRQGAKPAEHRGETLDMELQAEEHRRSQPQDPEAEEELSGSPT